MQKLLTIGLFIACVRAAHLVMDQSRFHSLVKRLTLMLRYFDEDRYFNDVYPLYRRMLVKNASSEDDPASVEYFELEKSMQEVKQMIITRRKATNIDLLIPKLSEKCTRLTRKSSVGIQFTCQAIAYYNSEFVSRYVLRKERPPSSPKELSVLLSEGNLWVNSIEFNTINLTLQRDILKYYARVYKDDSEIYAKLLRLSGDFQAVMKKVPKPTIPKSVVAELSSHYALKTPNYQLRSPIRSDYINTYPNEYDSINNFESVNSLDLVNNFETTNNFDSVPSNTSQRSSIEDNISLIFVAFSLLLLCTATVVNRYIL